MLEAITKKYTDHSDADSFAFSFYCDECGAEWRSVTLAFSYDGFEQPMDERVRTMLWLSQHSAVFERANREALFFFNFCAVCGKRVCDECFCACETENTDRCKQCAAVDNS